ncbi:hypothetical protein TNCV_550111 [Trichonephila clavipes]|nr:hypothetical protein TNCV_550111 [Trichonephila clavipes]
MDGFLVNEVVSFYVFLPHPSLVVTRVSRRIPQPSFQTYWKDTHSGEKHNFAGVQPSSSPYIGAFASFERKDVSSDLEQEAAKGKGAFIQALWTL